MIETILIVDDSVEQQKRVAERLVTLGVPPFNIYCASSASEARRSLSERYFDLMLLDVLLPNRSDSTASAENSIELLMQIIDDGTTRCPGYIVGITSDQNALQQHENAFRKLTTQILQIDPFNQEWLVSLSRILNLIRAGKNAESSYDVDICFQTALRKPEHLSIIDTLDAIWEPEEPLSRGLLFRRGLAKNDGSSFKIVAAHAANMGLVAATNLSDRLISSFKPKIMLMTGICAGLGSDAAIGDILVAEKSWDWQSGKWLDSGLQCSPDHKDGDSELISQARTCDDLAKDFYYKFSGNKPSTPPKIIIAPMVSGSSVVADSNMHNLLRAQHRKVGGLDMECYGMYYSCAMSNEPLARSLTVKGISDLGDQHKADDFQQYCSSLSGFIAFKVAAKTLASQS